MAFNIADLLDPTASVTESGKANAKLIPYENGDVRIVWIGEERERFNAYVKHLIEQAKEFYKPLYRKRARNKAAYETVGGKKEAIQLTLVRAFIGQQHAWLMNRLFSKAPMLSGRALGDEQTEIIIPPVMDQQTGEPKEEARIETITSVDAADGMADLVNYKWRYRLGMRAVFDAVLLEALQDGTFPAIARIVVTNGQPRRVKDNTLAQGKNAKGEDAQIVYHPEQRTIDSGERVQIKHIPGERFGKAPGPASIDESEWCWIEDEHPLSEIRRRLLAGLYDFGLGAKDQRSAEDQALFEQLAEMVLTGKARDPEPGDSKTASRPLREAHGENETLALDPRGKVGYHEFYCRWPILTEEEAAKPDPQIVMTEVVTDFCYDYGEQFCAWELPSWTGTRDIVDLFMRPRPGSYSGNSTGEDVAPYQRYMSQLFHLQIQTLVLQNQSAIFIQENSAAWTELERTARRVRPGFAYKITKPDDVQVLPLGKGVANLHEVITFLKELAQELALVTQWDTATAPLTRVTSGAFQQQQALAKMQPEYVYENVCDFVQRLALKYVQRLIQYGPSQHLPAFAQKTKAVIGNMLHLPRKMVTDADFALEVVATSDDETKANALAQASQVLDTMQKANAALVEGLAAITAPNMTPPQQRMGAKIIARSEEALGQVLKLIREDYANYIVTENDIEAMITSLHEMAQNLTPEGAEGGMVTAPQPADPNAPPPPAPPGPQAPPEPAVTVKYNVSLKGDLPPDQETAAAHVAGITAATGHAEPPPPAAPQGAAGVEPPPPKPPGT